MVDAWKAWKRSDINNRVVEGTARNPRLSRLLGLSAFYAILDFTEFSDFSDFSETSDLFRNLRLSLSSLSPPSKKK